MLEGLTEIYMAPAKAIKEGPKSLTEKPIGTGPYKLQEWKREQGITLIRNDGYWGRRHRSPPSKSASFRMWPRGSPRCLPVRST